MLKIRLARTGKKHKPTYRIVVCEHTAPIKSNFVDIVGYYLPTQKPKVFEVDKDRITHWISKGAKPSDTVHNLLVDNKILTDKRDIRYSRVKDVKQKSPKVAEGDKAPEETDAPKSTVDETPLGNDEANTQAADAPTANEEAIESSDVPATDEKAV